MKHLGVKPPSQAAYKAGCRCTSCRAAHAEHNRAWYRANTLRARSTRNRAFASARKQAEEQLGGACNRCGAQEGLEFDHVDPETKTIAISTALAQRVAKARLVEELAKCQLLCKPCHAEKSHENGDYVRAAIEGLRESGPGAYAPGA